MKKIVCYWHTVRHLRFSQLYGRLWIRLRPALVDLRPAPPIRVSTSKKWVIPAQRNPSMVGLTSFNFLNKTCDLDICGWDDPSLDKLWRYNLHYFDDLNAKGAIARKEWHLLILRRWIHENPPAKGTGWEPYPTSLRIVNWIKWAQNGNELAPECTASLAVQCRWLAQRVETHLLGNHLLSNAKALIFAGLFFDSQEALAWLEIGLGILKKEMPEQILVDGGHFERSTMYHALVLEDLLDIHNIAGNYLDAVPLTWRGLLSGWRLETEKMRTWLAVMSHPDGEISFFNDAAIGIAPAPAELTRYAIELGFEPQSTSVKGEVHLIDSGYVRINMGVATALLDVAPLGPDYLPGHGHADTLSFELSLFGKRLLVNSGTECYGTSQERLWQRSTKAHNTLVIDDKDSSEVWGGFRVARRAYPCDLSIQEGENIVQVNCSHNGYMRLSPSLVHTRCWKMTPGKLEVTDVITGSFSTAVAYFYLHPDVQVEELGNELKLNVAGAHKVHISFIGANVSVKNTVWHPEFGLSIPNRCLEVSLQGHELITVLSWD